MDVALLVFFAVFLALWELKIEYQAKLQGLLVIVICGWMAGVMLVRERGEKTFRDLFR